MAKIAFDITQKERGRIFENYNILRKNLSNLGHICQAFDEPLVKITSFAKYDLLVLACPDNSKLTEDEINSILNYVKHGGGLLLLSHAGGDKGLRTNLRELTGKFGFYFNNDQVFDYEKNLGYQSYALIEKLEPHEITNEIKNFCYRIGCSLTVKNNIKILANSRDSSIPQNAPLIASTEYGKGRIIGIGSYELFRDDVKGGIEYKNNLNLAINLFLWLSKKQKQIENQNIGANSHIKTLYTEIPDKKDSKIIQPDLQFPLKEFLTNITKKFDEITSNQLKIQTELKKFNNKISLIEKKIENINLDVKKPLDVKNPPPIKIQEKKQDDKIDFIKASDLISQKPTDKPKKSEIISKIEICKRLLHYLNQELESNSISEETFNENKRKIVLKIEDLKNKMNF
ncbi:MAG: hypothetical protein ACTSRG_02480 [Candidatus Helarchaeota archaeon]